MASSSGNSFPFSSHLGILRRQQFQSVLHEESNVGDSTDVQKLHLPRDDLVFLASYKDAGKDGQTRNWPADDYNNSPIKKGNYLFTDDFILSMYFLVLSFFKWIYCVSRQVLYRKSLFLFKQYGGWSLETCAQ